MHYSPDGKFLAVGTHSPGRVRIYDVESGYEKVAEFSKSNSFITSIDFSCDGASC